MRDEDFVRRVKEEMQTISENQGILPERKGDLFALFFASRILGFDEGSVAEEYHVGGTGDFKIDLGIVDDERPLAYVAQCKYQDNPLGGDSFNEDLVDEVLAAANRIRSDPEGGNSKRKEFVSIYLKSRKLTRFLAVGFGGFQPNAYKYALGNPVMIWEDRPLNPVEVWDYSRIKREYESRFNPGEAQRPEFVELTLPIDRVLKFSSVDEEKGAEPEPDTFIVALPVVDLHTWAALYGNGIFEENLRYKISSSFADAISERIKETLKNQPADFIRLNNGITVFAESVSAREENGSLCLHMHRPQIINGCQTSFAVYEFVEQMNEAHETFQDVTPELLAKIVIGPDTLVETITESANLQNPITARDRKSNHQYQKDIQGRMNALFRTFYERKAGDWSVVEYRNQQGHFKVPGYAKRYRQIDNKLSGQLIMALYGRPDIAKAEKKFIFEKDEYHDAVFGHDTPYEQRIETLDLARRKPCIVEGIDAFCEDLMFGFSVYALANSIKTRSLKEKMSQYDEEADADSEIYRCVKEKRFLRYWQLYLVSLCQEVIEHKTSRDRNSIIELRRRLLNLPDDGDWDLFFSTPKKMADKFNVENRPELHTVISAENPSEGFWLLGKWLVTFEQIVFDQIQKLREQKDWSSYNHFFDKRRESLGEIRSKVLEKAGGAYTETHFPSAVPDPA